MMPAGTMEPRITFITLGVTDLLREVWIYRAGLSWPYPRRSWPPNRSARIGLALATQQYGKFIQVEMAG
jgi:hypothetical protein